MQKLSGAALLLIASWTLLALACSDSLKAAGERCYGSAECQEGLTCDLGQSPPVCAEGQTRVDANDQPAIDATPMADADPAAPDANKALPDAATPVPDAATPVPDAATPVPDAQPAPDAPI